MQSESSHYTTARHGKVSLQQQIREYIAQAADREQIGESATLVNSAFN